MKKLRLLFLFLLLAAATGFSYLCSFSYVDWNVVTYACSLAALFATGTMAFVLFFRAKRFSIIKTILFSVLGGLVYIGLHFGMSYVINHLIFNNAFPFVTALFTTVYSTLFFLILSLLSIEGVERRRGLHCLVACVMCLLIFVAGIYPVQKRTLEELKIGYVYQDDIAASDLAAVPETHITNRLYSSRWGVFIHYLCGAQNNPGHPSNMGVGMTEWSDCVDDLDVNLLAEQLHESGAHFLYITIMQGTRHMIAPNKAYDEITGMKPGEACAKRDLVLDLYDALEPYGIDLYLYTTGDGPHADSVCGPKMGFVEGHVTKKFVNNWASVLREYAVRYGDKIKGWWIDGCYRARFGYTDELMKPYYDAVKEGNPNAVVAFNNGVANYYRKNYCDEDYVCGEFNYFNVVPRSRFVDGAQTFLLAPLGTAKYTEGVDLMSDWGSPGTRYTGEYMHNFVACCNEMGGVVAIDIGLKRDGSLYPEQLAVLKQIEP